jgi:L-asparaginase II
MAEPIRVAVRRGTFVESVHEVHAVAVRDGEVVAIAGDPALVASLRSSAKPLQALPLARAYSDLGDEELAIAAASHLGTPRHVEAVRKLLAATGGSEDELDCGIEPGRPPEQIYDNCSGKHAGMLAVCRANGWPVEGYRRAEHPLQRLLLDEVAAAIELEQAEIGTGIDGCGVVAFAVPLERAARAFARLEALDGGARIAAAMRAHPELIRGEGATDTELMRANPGVLAKGGAEGLLCVRLSDSTGLALKVLDGNGRALPPALAEFGASVGLELPEFEQVSLQNRHGEAAATVSLT